MGEDRLRRRPQRPSAFLATAVLAAGLWALGVAGLFALAQT